ncbi:MAG: hypothetical protein JXB50_01240 [Spirochaetes bacterium]|nr:hypothetical protein [Spirochaetota bacterium]
MSKKFFIITLLISLLLTHMMLYPAEKKVEKIKRTIAILPVVNQNNAAEYNYLNYTIRDALKAQLLHTEQFLFSGFSDIDNELTKMNIKDRAMIGEENAKAIALKVKADVVVTGKFVVIADKIMIQMDAYDIFINQSVASSSIRGDVGLDIFRIVDDVSINMADKMSKKLTMVDKTYFDEMLKTQEDFIKKKRKLERQMSFRLSKINTAGLALTVTGGTFLASGIVLLVYDLGFYMDKVKEYHDYGITDSSEYNTYQDAYRTFIALFSIGVTSLVLGVISTAVGIPLLVYKDKKKKVSLNIAYNNGINVAFRFKL